MSDTIVVGSRIEKRGWFRLLQDINKKMDKKRVIQLSFSGFSYEHMDDMLNVFTVLLCEYKRKSLSVWVSAKKESLSSEEQEAKSILFFNLSELSPSLEEEIKIIKDLEIEGAVPMAYHSVVKGMSLDEKKYLADRTGYPVVFEREYFTGGTEIVSRRRGVERVLESHLPSDGPDPQQPEASAKRLSFQQAVARFG